MTAHHHPSEELLVAFATGRLDHGEHLIVAAHVQRCVECQAFVRAIEELAGRSLEGISPVAMKFGAHVEPQVASSLATAKPEPNPNLQLDPKLPGFLDNYQLGPWKWIAPGVSMRPIILAEESKSRAFILRSKPGTRMLDHTHSGVELTHVISGEFSHEGGRFRAGDFDYGDENLHHRPIVASGEPCVCLVAMTGELEPDSWIGRIMKPLIRL